MRNKQEWMKEFIFLLSLGIFLFSWSVIQPLNVSPDEHMRYQICQYIYEHHGLPHGGDPSIRDAVWGYSYAFLPVLPQIFGAWFMTAVSWVSKEPFVLLMAARMVNILCGVGMAWFCLRIGERIWKKSTFKWLFTILATMLPQSLFLFSYLNNDAMALMATSMILYAWVLGRDTGWSYPACVWMAIGIIVCTLTYYNAYGVILASIFLFLGTMVCQWRDKQKRLDLLKKGILISVIVLLGTGWWFIRNYMMYDGDFLGLTTAEAYSQMYGIDSIKPSNRQTPCQLGQSLWEMMFARGWLKLTIISFIGCFGYVSIPLKMWMYILYAIIMGAGLVASVFYAVRQRKAEWKNRLLVMAMILTALIPNLLNLTHSYFVDFQPQGRYSMPMLLPFMYFVTVGWGYLLGAEKMTMSKWKSCPKKYCQRWAVPVLVVLWIVLALVSYFYIFYPQTCI